MRSQKTWIWVLVSPVPTNVTFSVFSEFHFLHIYNRNSVSGFLTSHFIVEMQECNECHAWKKSHDQLRQHIKKQRHYFAHKDLSSQGYGFSSSHAWIWELDCEEGWALKNWCFWTVVLEKTLESPLDCKEIQPVLPKGDQSWVLIGRTDAAVETPILWLPDA